MNNIRDALVPFIATRDDRFDDECISFTELENSSLLNFEGTDVDYIAIFGQMDVLFEIFDIIMLLEGLGDLKSRVTMMPLHSRLALGLDVAVFAKFGSYSIARLLADDRHAESNVNDILSRSSRCGPSSFSHIKEHLLQLFGNLRVVIFCFGVKIDIDSAKAKLGNIPGVPGVEFEYAVASEFSLPGMFVSCRVPNQNGSENHYSNFCSSISSNLMLTSPLLAAQFGENAFRVCVYNTLQHFKDKEHGILSPSASNDKTIIGSYEHVFEKLMIHMNSRIPLIPDSKLRVEVYCSAFSRQQFENSLYTSGSGVPDWLRLCQCPFDSVAGWIELHSRRITKFFTFAAHQTASLDIQLLFIYLFDRFRCGYFSLEKMNKSYLNGNYGVKIRCDAINLDELKLTSVFFNEHAKHQAFDKLIFKVFKENVNGLYFRTYFSILHYILASRERSLQNLDLAKNYLFQFLESKLIRDEKDLDLPISSMSPLELIEAFSLKRTRSIVLQDLLKMLRRLLECPSDPVVLDVANQLSSVQKLIVFEKNLISFSFDDAIRKIHLKDIIALREERNLTHSKGFGKLLSEFTSFLESKNQFFKYHLTQKGPLVVNPLVVARFVKPCVPRNAFSLDSGFRSLAERYKTKEGLYAVIAYTHAKIRDLGGVKPEHYHNANNQIRVHPLSEPNFTIHELLYCTGLFKLKENDQCLKFPVPSKPHFHSAVNPKEYHIFSPNLQFPTIKRVPFNNGELSLLRAEQGTLTSPPTVNVESLISEDLPLPTSSEMSSPRQHSTFARPELDPVDADQEISENELGRVQTSSDVEPAQRPSSASEDELPNPLRNVNLNDLISIEEFARGNPFLAKYSLPLSQIGYTYDQVINSDISELVESIMSFTEIPKINATSLMRGLISFVRNKFPDF